MVPVCEHGVLHASPFDGKINAWTIMNNQIFIISAQCDLKLMKYQNMRLEFH